MSSLTEIRDETPPPLTDAAVRAAAPRRNRWPARLDVLQSLSGLFLALLLIAHMGFVSTIQISHEAFYAVARFFEAA